MPSDPTQTNPPSIELHSSQPAPEIEKRVRRLMIDVKMLQVLTVPETRAVYQELESARDCLSIMLDRADGKSN